MSPSDSEPELDCSQSQPYDDPVSEALSDALTMHLRSAAARGGRGRRARGSGRRRSARQPKRKRPEVNLSSEEENTELMEEIISLGDKIKSLEAELNSIKTMMNNLKSGGESIKSLINKEKTDTEEHRRRIEDIDKRSRMLQMIVAYPEFASIKKENFRDEVIDIMCDKLRLSSKFINRFAFHRIGKDGNKILFYALDEFDKTEIFRAARTMKPRDFYVNENLTSRNRQIFFELRQMKKSKKILSVYSYRGDIYCKKDSNSRSVRIDSLRSLGVNNGASVVDQLKSN